MKLADSPFDKHRQGHTPEYAAYTSIVSADINEQRGIRQKVLQTVNRIAPILIGVGVRFCNLSVGFKACCELPFSAYSVEKLRFWPNSENISLHGAGREFWRGGWVKMGLKRCSGILETFRGNPQ